MSEILLRVKDTRLTLEGPAWLVGTQVEYNTCKFDFGPEWADFVKTAVFRTGDKTINMVLDEEDKCNVPWESVAEKGVLYVGVFGTRDGVVIPTNFVTLNIVEGSAGIHAPAPPSLDVYMQIMQEMGDTRDYIDAMEAAIVSKEQARQDEYTEAEADRYNKYSIAETNRNNQYDDAENTRNSSYQDIERTIVQNEDERIESEETRQENENARVESENTRRESEDLRADAEDIRIGNEDIRISAEGERENAEIARQGNENERIEAEIARSVFENYSPTKQYGVGNKVAYQGSSFRCVIGCKNIPPMVGGNINGDNWLLIARKGDVYFPTFSVDANMELTMHDNFNYDGTISFRLDNGCLIQEVI